MGANRVNIFYLGLLLFIFSLNGPFLFGQDEQAVYSIVSASDQKKLDKANSYKEQADKLIEEANQLYLEVFSVQADYQLGEKEIKKRAGQLETKAQDKQLEAIELYRKSNEIKFSTNKIYIEKFWSEHEGSENEYVNARLVEEQSNDYYYQANSTRTEAGRLKDKKEKIQKFNDAYDLELLALEKQRTALGSYYIMNSTSSTETFQEQEIIDQSVQETEITPYSEVTQTEQETYQPDISSEIYSPSDNSSENQQEIYSPIPEQSSTTTGVEVNQDMIDQYRDFLNDSSNYPEGFLTPEMLDRINSFNADQILNLWYGYVYSQAYDENYAEENLEKAILNEEEQTVTDLGSTADKQASDAKPAGENEKEEKVIAEIHEGEDEKALLIPKDENVIYRVQVAAEKSQLDQKTLRKMYYGNKNVEMIDEDGWYKYSIGDFDNFETANKFRKQCGVKNAFIVAYRKGTIFETPAQEGITTPASFQTENLVTTDGLIFRVQVAASRDAIRKEQLAKICGGNYAIEQIEEDGWYKYQLCGVRLFSDALKIISAVKVENAFIVAYENGTKTELLDAVRRSVKIEKEVQKYGRKGRILDTEFFIQVAASKHRLKPDDLTKIYSGHEPVTIVIEEDWYKYRIKAGFDYNNAKNIRNSCGVEKAFIVPYSIAEKIMNKEI